MEVAGLAIGVVGIAGLFSTCLEALDKFDSYKEFGTDSQHLASWFEADKVRFRNWGRAIGFERDQLSDDHHKALDDPQIRLTVDNLLSSIRKICSDTDDAFQQPRPWDDVKSTRNRLFSRHQVQPYRSAPSESMRSKLTWALGGKAKRITQVKLLREQVQNLHNLVPPDGTKDTRVGHGGSTAGNHATGRPDRESSENGALTAELQRILVELEEKLEAETRNDVRAWLLGDYNPNELYDNSIRNRLDGTCDWILDRPAFRSWVSPAFPAGSKLLWINGPAGFGKTILCARVVEHIRSDMGAPIAYFFFSSDFDSRRGPYVAVKSWIVQMISQPKAIEVVYDKWAAQYAQVATRANIVELFREIVQAIPGYTFVLDSLDECNRTAENQKLHNDDSLAGFLETVRQVVAQTNTRIMLVSRDELEIRQGLPSDASENFFEYKISAEDVRPDTVSYSRSIVNRKLFKKPETIKGDISQRMAERCNGQFLWLKMQEGNLRSGKNKKQIEDAIDRTPTGLEHLYDRNWTHIYSEEGRESSTIYSAVYLIGRVSIEKGTLRS